MAAGSEQWVQEQPVTGRDDAVPRVAATSHNASHEERQTDWHATRPTTGL